jgi:hypothetical protein
MPRTGARLPLESPLAPRLSDFFKTAAGATGINIPMKHLFVCTALLALSTAAHAQPPSNVPEQVKAMQSCAFLAGHWAGEGWAAAGPGQRHTFHETESVEPRLGGLLLLIEGAGTGPTGQSTHGALAVMSYDAEQKQYRFRAYEQMGHYTDALAECHDNTLIWTLENGPATIRYTIKLTPQGQWHEVGMLVMKGAPEQQIFEMTLDRNGG